MSINRGMDKEDVLHIYNGILLSHKKEWNSVICRDMDGPRECYTEWSKSEREKQILYNNAYMWNLEKWYRWSYLQSRNRDTEVENKCMDTKEERGEVAGIGRLGLIHIHYWYYVKNRQLMGTYCIEQGTLPNALWCPKWRKIQKGGDICMCMVDSFCCSVEANTTL